jgi:hypothetical protein
MPINSRQKGARGERELAKFLTNRRYPARRGQQFSGSPDSPDVVCDPLKFLHIECKFVQNLNVYKALEQAQEDAGDAQTAVCIHRRKQTPWHITLTMDDFLDLLERGIDMHALQDPMKSQCLQCDSFEGIPVPDQTEPLWRCRVCLHEWGE